MIDSYLSSFINLYLIIRYILKVILQESIISVPVVVLGYFPCGFFHLNFS